MALPAGALTATVTVGGSVGIAGTSAVVSNFTVTPEYRLVWGATGDAIDTFAEDGTAGSIVILADQPGVFASSTVNGAAGLMEVRGWPLVARWRVTSGGDSRWHTRRFAAPTAGTTVDVDMLPQDGAAVPGTVTYAQTITVGSGDPAAIAQAVTEYLTANPPEMGALTDLSDVTIGDSTEGDVLTLGPLGEWCPAALDLSGYDYSDFGAAASSHSHAPADVTGTAVVTNDTRLSDARTPLAHKASHATGGTDALAPGDIGAATAAQGALAASASQPGHTHTLDATTDTATRLALTPAERTKLTNTSGTNTGDQTLPTWSTLSGKPAVIGAGATAADARTAIGAGTSSLVIGTGAGDAKAGNYTPPDATTSVKGLVQLAGDLAGTAAAPTVVAASETVAGKVELATTAEATTGTDTTRAVTPAGVKAVADTKAATSHTHDDRYYTETEADARFAPVAQPVNAQTAAYTLVAGDVGKLVTMTLSTAGDLTVPANVVTVPAGTVVRVDVLDLGTARVTFVQGSGMTLTGAPTLVSSARYAGFSVIFTSATTATVVGALAAA